MDPARYQRMRDLFHELSRAAPEQREALLETACTGDSALRDEVRALLEAAPQRNEFLSRPVVSGDALCRLAEEAQVGDTASPLPVSIGNYTVTGLIGEGGMGVVYAAMQDSPRRAVAVKLIRPGPVSAGLIRRLQQEAELLGRLQHPGIARVFEAGVAEVTWPGAPALRQPFVAMELIAGEPVTRIAPRLSVPGRLRLLADIADAVHSAHQRGVIHRDLKPANILARLNADGAASATIIDFGIARALDTGATETLPGHIIGTLAYMSPEQLDGGAGAASTASDIYSLGIIGYELFAGCPPFALEGLSLSQAAVRIRSSDPPPLAMADRFPRGDIGAVIGKAMEKDASRRYASASDLAADLLRVIRREPVSARPVSGLYQLTRLVQRHRAAASGVLVAVAGLVLGLGVASWQALRATRELGRARAAESRAQVEAETARRMASCLESVLTGLDPLEGNAGDGSLPAPSARAILDSTGSQIALELHDRPLERASLLRSLGAAYMRQGLYGPAQACLDSCLEIRREQLPGSPALAEALSLCAELRRRRGDYAGAARQEAESLAILERAHADPERIAEHEVALSRALVAGGDPGAAVEKALSGVQHFRASSAPSERTIDALGALSAALSARGDSPGAMGAIDEAISLAREQRPGSVALVMLLAHRAVLQRSRGDAGAGASQAAEAARAWALAPDRRSARGAACAIAVGSELDANGFAEQAEPFLREGLDTLRKRLGANHIIVPEACLRLATHLHNRARPAEAEPLYREALRGFRRVAGEDHPDVGTCLLRLAQTGADRHDEASLRQVREEALALEAVAASLPEDHPHRSGALLLRGYVELALGNAASAEVPLRRCIDLRQRQLGPGHRLTLYARSVLGTDLVALGRTEEGAAELRASVPLLATLYGEHSLMTAEALGRLAAITGPATPGPPAPP